MRVTFQLPAKDFQHGMNAWRNRSAWRRWNRRLSFGLMRLLLVASAGLLLYSFFRKSRVASNLIDDLFVIFGASAGWLIWMWAAPAVFARLQFRRMPTAQTPMELEISEAGLRVRSVHSDAECKWSAYIGWAEDQSVFVLFPQPRIYIPIPKRAFTPEQEITFRETLARCIPLPT
jgi:hypothetical protein